MTLSTEEFERVKQTYPDHIEEILSRHIRTAKLSIAEEAKRINSTGEVPESG